MLHLCPLATRVSRRNVRRGGERDAGLAEDPLEAARDEQRTLQGQVQAQAQPPHRRARRQEVSLQRNHPQMCACEIGQVKLAAEF